MCIFEAILDSPLFPRHILQTTSDTGGTIIFEKVEFPQNVPGRGV